MLEYTVSRCVRNQQITEKFFISYLRIRKGTQKGQFEHQGEEKESNTCERNFISINQHYGQITKGEKCF